MKTYIYTTAVLLCATIAQGDKCRFNVPVTSSVLKCRDEVYQTDQKTMDAVNSCGEGKNGSEITDQDVRCVSEKLGYIENGKLNPEAIMAANEKHFPRHHVQLSAGAKRCAILNDLEVSQQPEKEVGQFKHFNCRFNVFKDVCGHTTCDWINTID